jgi:hypothetical protein
VVADADALGTYEALRRATLVAIAAGADFVGGRTAGGLPAAALCVLEAIRDVAADTGLAVARSSTSSSSTRRSAGRG